MTTWSDTPPTEAGWYWVKGRCSGEIWPTRLHDDGSWECTLTMVQFGPRITPADELAELTQLAEVGRKALESWGMTLEQWQAIHGTKTEVGNNGRLNKTDGHA